MRKIELYYNVIKNLGYLQWTKHFKFQFLSNYLWFFGLKKNHGFTENGGTIWCELTEFNQNTLNL